MRFLAGFVASLLMIAIAVAAVIYGGVYNVAATEPHHSARRRRA